MIWSPLTQAAPPLPHTWFSPCAAHICQVFNQAGQRTADIGQLKIEEQKKMPTLRLHPALSLPSAWPQPPVVTSLAMHAPGGYHTKLSKEKFFNRKRTHSRKWFHLAS